MARSKKAQESDQLADGAMLEPEAGASEVQAGFEWEPQTDVPEGEPQAGPDNGQSEIFDGGQLQSDLAPDAEQPPGELDLQTGSEMDDFPIATGAEIQLGEGSDTAGQFGMELSPGTDKSGAMSQGDWAGGAGSGPDEPNAPPDPVLDTGQTEPDRHSETAEVRHLTPAQAARRLRMPERGPRVVSIDAERTVETEADRQHSNLLDLMESLKGKRILSDTIQGVERPSPDSELSYAVIYHGDFKVIIPVLETVEEPEDYRGQPKGDALYYLLNKRLGAEVDYIIKGIDPENGVAVGSRLEAMAMKRREYYFRTDRDGNYQIYEGIRAEARVVSVIRAGIFIDLFGAECYIPLRELSYQRWMDAAAHYQSGQRVLVKVLEVDRSDQNRPRIAASVKQASENPYEKALQKYTVNCLYVGSVSLVDLTGVFVSLDGGIDCLCSHPKRGRPPRGARVTVRILGIDHDTNRIWGVITHMSTAR